MKLFLPVLLFMHLCAALPAMSEYAVSEIMEKKWGFRANILDKNGSVIDRVMIDKRTGRIRSLN